MTATGKRRWLAPEVVQTSAMDCGPASMSCLLEGFGIPVSYGRLREACQTGVDGTNIDTIEELARQLGLEAEQIMLPRDHLFVPGADVTPALLVVRQPSGLSHFIVIWRRVGSLVMVMDPSSGRRWVNLRRLMGELFIHTTTVPAAAFRSWAGSEDFLDTYRRRLAQIGCAVSAAPLLERALGDPGWQAVAALDAATRQVAALVGASGVRAGREAAELLAVLFERALREPSEIPDAYWTVRASPSDGGEPELALRGAVLIRVRGRRGASGVDSNDGDAGQAKVPDLTPELRRALDEAPIRPGRMLLGWLLADGPTAPLSIALALGLAVSATLLEAVLLRGLLDVGRLVAGLSERLAAIGALLAFLLAQLALEASLTSHWLGLGRKLEVRLRLAFAQKLPRLSDRYFQSRPVSDMAERCHGIHSVRQVPELIGQALRASFELVATSLAIVWFDPSATGLALSLAIVALLIPLASQPVLIERELKIRVHVGAMMRFFLDALLGLMPVRAHIAERQVQREHEALVVDWVTASRALARFALASEALGGLFIYGLVVLLVFSHVHRPGEQGTALLLVYWALQIPALGEELASVVRQYPTQRNRIARLVEPLGAIEEPLSEPATSEVNPAVGMRVSFEQVRVVANGHVILDNIDCDIAAGSHIAIVGASGAGKSTLVGLLLGWHRASSGRVKIDERELTASLLAQVREATAWVDPAVMLWNRSFYDNLRYGVRERHPDIGPVLQAADLKVLLEGLPSGLSSVLGEGGGMLSGGEGQRLRFGRALLRGEPRLVVLDEPFRGLDRETRRGLLAAARDRWRNTTLILITHDVHETLDFDRVLVLGDGRIREDGKPRALCQHSSARYAELLSAERHAMEHLWGAEAWRQIRLEGGRLVPHDTSAP